MGTMNALGMAHAATTGELSLDAALHYHLTANHYPPVPTYMIPIAKRAIELANDDDWDERIELPDGVTWKGQPTVPVADVVEAFHLDAFLAPDDDL